MDFYRGLDTDDLPNAQWKVFVENMPAIKDQIFDGCAGGGEVAQWMESQVGLMYALATASEWLPYTCSLEIDPPHVASERIQIAEQIWKLLQKYFGLRGWEDHPEWRRRGRDMSPRPGGLPVSGAHLPPQRSRCPPSEPPTR